GRIADAQRAARVDVLAALLERLAQRLLVLDHEPDMAAAVGGGVAVGRALAQGQELVAEVDPGHRGVTAAEREGEVQPVPLERLVEIIDLEGDMIDADRAYPHEVHHKGLGGRCWMNPVRDRTRACY